MNPADLLALQTAAELGGSTSRCPARADEVIE